MNGSSVRIAVIAVLLAAVAQAALAWGDDGHEIVGALAYGALAPPTRVKVDALLALEPGSSLRSISTWADKTKNRATARWHFVNFPPDDCHFLPDRDCPGGNCAVAAIERQLAVLRRAGVSQEGFHALKYVTHLVADLHQPLHAGMAHDKGGNLVQVRAFGRGTNLHSLWDSGVIKESGRADVWLTKVRVPANKGAVDRATPAQVAEESCRIAHRPGFYPDRKVSQLYLYSAKGVIEARLLLASTRLAGMLEEALRE